MNIFQEINKNNALYTVCLKMAEDEKMHAKTIIDQMNQMPLNLAPMDTLKNAKNIFQYSMSFLI